MASFADTLPVPDLDRVLAWVNSVRRDCGLADLDTLPAGQPKSCLQCVLARALSTDAHQAVVSYWAGASAGTVKCADGAVRDLPEHVAQFACVFDAGKLPGLIERR